MVPVSLFLISSYSLLFGYNDLIADMTCWQWIFSSCCWLRALYQCCVWKKNLNIPFENKGVEFQLVYISGIPLISFPRILIIEWDSSPKRRQSTAEAHTCMMALKYVAHLPLASLNFFLAIWGFDFSNWLRRSWRKTMFSCGTTVELLGALIFTCF